ncbi:hypothetical protein GCM10027396_18200 [Insolitispirillum peregrinum]
MCGVALHDPEIYGNMEQDAHNSEYSEHPVEKYHLITMGRIKNRKSASDTPDYIQSATNIPKVV